MRDHLEWFHFEVIKKSREALFSPGAIARLGAGFDINVYDLAGSIFLR
jgi:hypothetical protein